jgi:hypothetical protein
MQEFHTIYRQGKEKSVQIVSQKTLPWKSSRWITLRFQPTPCRKRYKCCANRMIAQLFLRVRLDAKIALRSQDAGSQAFAGGFWDRLTGGYLWVMTKTPSQFTGGSSNRYSWQRFQYMREGPSSGHLSSNS